MFRPRSRRRLIYPSLLLAAAALAPAKLAQADKDLGADLPAQAAADALKSFAGADAAFVAAGELKDAYDKSADLSTMLLYPTEGVEVVKLTGKQVRDALERAVSLYPQPNTSFLQLAGFQATFRKGGSASDRIASVTLGGANVSPGATYRVAMFANLAEGGYGYFKIWEKSDVVKTFPNASAESVLKGKRYADSPPRWVALSSSAAPPPVPPKDGGAKGPSSTKAEHGRA